MLDLVLTLRDRLRSFLTNTDATFKVSKHNPSVVLQKKTAQHSRGGHICLDIRVKATGIAKLKSPLDIRRKSMARQANNTRRALAGAIVCLTSALQTIM